jgi:IMP dehydrogenase/GMP reductase
MGSTVVIRIVEVGLMLGFVLHIVQGIMLEIQNRRTRKIGYAVAMGNKGSKWYSRSMGLLGTLILIFLVIHLSHFWIPNRSNQGWLLGEEINLYERMKITFQELWVVIVYVVGCISNKYPQILLIAGNVATGSAAKRLWQVGADIVKVGVGPGSLCTTRIETGNGVPQLTALMDVYTAKKDLEKELYNKTAKKTNNIEWLTTDQLAQSNIIKIRKLMIMADGGIKSAGDIVKALCFADLVMIGNMFAGTEESPGTTIIRDGIAYKEYVGSSTHKTNHIEGVEAIVPYKGKFTDILTKILEGIKSGCSYQGVSSLLELREDPQFIRITNAGLKESNHHDVRVI